MERRAALDGLRGLAAAMVFVHHVQLPGLAASTIGLDAGVIVFFVLSGYLIYRPFVGSKAALDKRSLAGYAVRRFLRIVPAYLVAAFAIAAFRYPWLLRDPVGLATTVDSSIVVVWTLQIEATFYVFVPVFAWLVTGWSGPRRIRAILLMSGGSLVFTIGVIFASVSVNGYVWSSDVSTIGSYLWAFGAGMVVAELDGAAALRDARSPAVAAFGAGLILTAWAIHAPKFLDVPAAAGSAMLIAFLISRPTPARWTPLLAAAGAVSYSVYLWHEAVIDAVDRPATWLGAAGAAVLTLAVASLVYVLVERPANHLGRATSRRLASRFLSTLHVRDAPVTPGAITARNVETPAASASTHG
jgi:peptidoglycan/LPS O-acetylase OafA/YrhL